MSEENDSCIWISTAGINSENAKEWWEMDREDKKGEQMSDGFYNAMRSMGKGDLLDASDLPSSLYQPKNIKNHSQPSTLHFFSNGAHFVSSESAAILREFDMGIGVLHPIKFFESDKKTELASGFCILNIAAIKNAYLPEQSLRERRLYEGYDIWAPPQRFKMMKWRFQQKH